MKKISVKFRATILGLVNPNSSKILDLQKEILTLIIPKGASVVLVDLDVMTLVVIQLISTGLE